MNFQANNLDAAYSQVKELNTLATTTGVNLVESLTSNIKSLKSHWKGSDATLHINNLINVREALVAIVSDVSAVAHNVSMPIVQAQTIRNSNGGGGEVGEIISLYNGVLEKIETLSDTTEYFVDPVNAPLDHQQLSSICDQFNSFYTSFQSIKEDLMNNWISGSDRGQAVSDFEQFEANATTYSKNLTEARDNLGIATSNLAQM